MPEVPKKPTRNRITQEQDKEKPLPKINIYNLNFLIEKTSFPKNNNPKYRI